MAEPAGKIQLPALEGHTSQPGPEVRLRGILLEREPSTLAVLTLEAVILCCGRASQDVSSTLAATHEVPAARPAIVTTGNCP